MDTESLLEAAQTLSEQALDVATNAKNVQVLAQQLALAASENAAGASSPLMMGLTILILSVFIGYYVVWRVTPALHSPLMAVTNAISSVIIVGGLISAGLPWFGFAKVMGFLAVTLAAVNIFGGFVVTQRMLHMFNKKK
ncbi:MAG: NAD(P) transhydrogenase subunit alpha [Alphaproteobacteria bacterium]|nr:NAD(P) transhydrogenase subunit alpha [Alphaproteobacteria bacterium]